MRINILIATLVLLIRSQINAQALEPDSGIGSFREASDFTISQLGSLYITDLGTSELIAIDTLGKTIGKIGGYGWEGSAMSEPVNVNTSGLNLLITDRANKSVKLFDKELNFISELRSTEGAPFDDPLSAAENTKGDIYILDRGEKQIIKISTVTGTTASFGGHTEGAFSLDDPRQIRISRANILICSDKNELKFFDEFGNGLFSLPFGEEIIALNLVDDYLTILTSAGIIVKKMNELSKVFLRIDSGKYSSDVVGALYRGGKLYILTKNQIQIIGISE